MKLKAGLLYLKSKWVTIFIACVIGSTIGFAYSIYKKPTYLAACSFVLEDPGKDGVMSQFSSLSSFTGIDIGNSAGGLFQGDNIIELYKSRLMLEKTLLTKANFNGKTELLIDRYIDFNHLRKKWKAHDDIDKISFEGNPDNFGIKQDSIITDIVEEFNKNVLSVAKLDKKLSIIDVNVLSTDELFSKNFTNKLVETVNDFYVQTKTKKSYESVKILQHEADSVKIILNTSINGVASAIDAAPNANPLMNSLHVTSQKKQIDVQTNSAAYSEIIKNLEIAKITLRKEQPLIQVIDTPVLPLKKTKVGKLYGVTVGFIGGAFFMICMLSLGVFFENIFK